MQRLKYLSAAVILIGVTAVANAGIVFSNVNITGSLATGSSFTSVSPSIDFFFPDAIVGDPVDPRRSGNIEVTYEATADDAIVQDKLVLSVLGALAGSGNIFVNEVVEDLVTPGVIATHNAVLNSNSQLPHVAVLTFDRPSLHVKIKKTFFLNAIPDTDGFDVAAIGVVEQTLTQVPEPVSIVLFSLLGLARLRRR